MRSWRETSLDLALAAWAWLVVTTEGLSLIHQLNGGALPELGVCSCWDFWAIAGKIADFALGSGGGIGV